MSTTSADSPDTDSGQAGDGLSVSQAAATLGLSVNAVRHKIRRGTLPAVKVDGEWRVQVIEGMPPTPAASPRPGDATAAPEDRPPATPADYPVSATQQLEVVRDTLLRPLIEQNERQQAIIAEQAETIGRVTAERDALQGRVSELEARQTAQGDAPSSAPETATRAVWWRFWER